jgi:hypothetical protein
MMSPANGDVIAWLSTRKDAVPPIPPREVLAKLSAFQCTKREMEAAWGGHPPWPDVVLAAINAAKTLG